MHAMRGRALECLGHVAVAIGADHFGRYFVTGKHSILHFWGGYSISFHSFVATILHFFIQVYFLIFLIFLPFYLFYCFSEYCSNL